MVSIEKAREITNPERIKQEHIRSLEARIDSQILATPGIPHVSVWPVGPEARYLDEVADLYKAAGYDVLIIDDSCGGNHSHFMRISW